MSNPHSGLPPSSSQPPIVLSEPDAARLDALLEAPQWRRNPAAQALQAELLRARVLPLAQMPDDVVRMHSQVECMDAAGTRRTLTLVYPHEADSGQGRISVLAPAGSALLGLAVGQRIDWPRADGDTLRLEVTAVNQPAVPGAA